MDAATYLTAGLIDNGVEDVMLESALLKVFSSDALWQILFDTMQIYGGGHSSPTSLLREDARSRLNTIGEGSNEVMRAFIGVVGLRDVGVFLKELKDSIKKPFYNYKKIFSHLRSLSRIFYKHKIPISSHQLLPYASKLSSNSKRFFSTCYLFTKKLSRKNRR